ncbi:sugar phosphate isomerase/epimerase family protein [Bacillus taeanensis]|uniref:Sugar phosphate isomerase/epimerase n=1 Tax=Bacillus taeanensis TaxID=273032 RepID=A0A366XR56_9BACI|nr:sugar phosphate isomerase/epimerase family protein [Bacillus taeanensis]RBW68377.1 sugar phosphate isomerase/epimerase [Bacillus taeanensis]
MKIGISTYALRWEWEFVDKIENPLDIYGLLYRVKELGAEAFQICDYPPIEEMSTGELQAFKEKAKELGIELELGTQGVYPDHLLKYLKIANALEVKVLRTMVHDKVHQPSIAQAEEWLKKILPSFELSGVKIALETYEPVKTSDLVSIVKSINSSYIGICLDPGNSISELEFPDAVIENTAPYVTNCHLKDFVFKRREGSIGFNLLGAPVGDGQLNLDFLLETLKKEGKTVNGIIELWLPFTESAEKTAQLQTEWIQKSIANMKKKLSSFSAVEK